MFTKIFLVDDPNQTLDPSQNPNGDSDQRKNPRENPSQKFFKNVRYLQHSLQNDPLLHLATLELCSTLLQGRTPTILFTVFFADKQDIPYQNQTFSKFVDILYSAISGLSSAQSPSIHFTSLLNFTRENSQKNNFWHYLPRPILGPFKTGDLPIAYSFGYQKNYREILEIIQESGKTHWFDKNDLESGVGKIVVGILLKELLGDNRKFIINFSKVFHFLCLLHVSTAHVVFCHQWPSSGNTVFSRKDEGDLAQQADIDDESTDQDPENSVEDEQVGSESEDILTHSESLEDSGRSEEPKTDPLNLSVTPAPYMPFIFTSSVQYVCLNFLALLPLSLWDLFWMF